MILKITLGNVRLTFTSGSGSMMMNTYTATMEPNADKVETVAFDNVESTRQLDALNNHTPDGMASARLNAAEGKVIGPSLSLHLMNGDTVQMKVFAKYNKRSDTKAAITDIASIISGMLSSNGLETEAGSFVNDLSNSLGATQAGLMKSDDGIPKAFLNYLFFDKNMQYKKGGFAQVSEKANGNFEELSLNFIPDQEGYIMVNTSNQTADNTDVFFPARHSSRQAIGVSNEGGDDLSILHTSGPIVRVDDYYPYGLTYNTSQLSGVLTNKYLYNDKEFQDELGLNLYDYGARFYDPELGRWHSIDPMAEVARRWSPYKYGCDNPLKYIDKDGMMDISESMKKEQTKFGFYNRTNSFGSFLSDYGDDGSGEPLTQSATPKWASKPGAEVHQQANEKGIYRNGMPKNSNEKKLMKEEITALNEGTVFADKSEFQIARFSFQHAMRNGDIDQSPEQAMELADKFVRENFYSAKQFLKEGKIHDAYRQFAIGLHALQDATSPSHAGFQSWSDHISPYQEAIHMWKELSYPGINSNLQNITNIYLNWFQNSYESLPSNNLFIGINHD